MKNIYYPTRLDSRMEARLRRIVELSRRRDRLLAAPLLDLEELAILAKDYEAAHMPRAAMALRMRTRSFGRNGFLPTIGDVDGEMGREHVSLEETRSYPLLVKWKAK